VTEALLDFAYDPPERNPGKPLKWILIDSLIIAGIAFVSVLPSDRLPTILDTYVALKAFMYSLLVQLAVERGLKVKLGRKGGRK
jgi:hypothetical protein